MLGTFTDVLGSRLLVMDVSTTTFMAVQRYYKICVGVSF